MAGREKKQLGNKQPQVRRETEKTTKGTEPQKQEDVNPKTKESKQKTKDGVNEKRPILTRSTGGVRNKRILPCRDVSVKGSEQKTKRKLQSLARRNSQNIKLSQTCKLNKADISETKLPEDASTSAYDLKLTQSPRLLRTNRITKPDVKTEETNLNEISSSIDASPKIKSKVGRPRKLGTGTTDIRNGAKGRNMPYITRSDSPARVLRNGKRRKLKDPSLFEGLDLGFSKRRRLLSTTRDGSGSELGCKSEPILDDQSSIAGSDISFNDSPKVENGKGIWDSDFDSKTPVEDSKCETSSQEAHSSLCSTIKSETTTDSFLGKSISNRIAELINRNKFLESVQKDPVLNQEETCNIISPTTADSKESISKITANDKSLIDTNSNTFSKGIPSKLTGVGTVEHNCPHNSVKNAIVENRSLETKTKFPPTGTSIKKINSQDLKEFSSHKNGQNPLPVIDTHFTEKSSKKIRTLKNKQPRLFQALRSTSGTFYVVQNTIVKEEIKPITPPCGGRRLSSDLQVLNSEVKMEQPEDTDSTATLNINIDSLEKKTNTRVQPEEMASHNVEGTLHVLDRTISTVNSDVKADTTSNTIEDNKKEHVSPGTSSVNEITILDQIDSKLTSINSNCDNLIISNLKGDSHCNKDSDNKSHCISESVSNNEVHMRRNSGDSTIDYEENLSCKLSDDDVQSNSSNTYDLVNDCKYTTKDCEENVSDCKEGVSEVSKEKSVDCSEDHKEESSNCKNELSNCEVKSADHKEELRECENESSVPKEVFTDQRELIGSKEELINCEDELGDSMTELNDCAKDLGDDSINLQCKPDSDFSVFDNLTTDKIESISCPDFTVNEVNEISNSTDTSNKISNTNNKNCGMSKSGTTQLDDNLYKIGESVDFNSMNQPHVSMPFSETSRLKTDKQVTPDEVIDSSCSSIRRSSRSSVNKTNAALINCLKSSRKSVKSSALGKSRGMDEDGSVLQSPCVTEDDSTMDSSDITSIENVKNKDALPEEAVGVELAHFSSQDNPSEEGQETKTVVDIDMDEEQIEDVPPSRKTDLTLKKVMEDDPVVQDIGTGTLSMSSNKTSSLESSCVTAIDINSLESENASESHIFSNNELEGPVTDIDNCAASDVTDFTIVDSEKNIDIDDIALQGATMEECLNNEISNNEDGEIQTAETNISEQLSETNVASVKESENNAYVLKRNVQNGIEPALFYSKGNAKDKEIRTKFATNSVDCKSSEIVSTSENTEIIIENEDLKTDCEENKSELVLLHDDKPEVIRDDIICSDDVEMLDNVGDSFSPGVFQGDVDVNGQCELIPSLTLDYRDNEIAPEVRGLEIEELRCEELCSTGGNIVENDIEENLKTSESTSNVADTQTTNMEENVTPEELAIKVSVLSALGLQPLQSSQAGTSSCNSKTNDSSYTGTLKTVIKLQRSSPEKRRSSLKLVLKNGKAQSSVDDEDDDVKDDGNDEYESDDDGEEIIKYKICRETESSENSKDPFAFGIGSRKNLKQSYSYRTFDTTNSPQFVAEKSTASEQQTSDLNCQDDKSSSTKQSTSLVIPEKSSSFSIHPGRLCSDVCSYCFGKFGSLDTPCHVAQLKSHDRQQKILEAETHLTADSCLCDACYRHVDRKANCPSYKPNKKRQHHRNSTTQIKAQCCVQGCTQTAHHQVRRKWLIKLKRSITKKVPIDMDKMPQHLLFPLCTKHYSWVDFFMVCGICKRRLTRNHMYPLGPEVHELNTALANDGIPVRLSDKLFLCKLCRYFASVRLKHKDPSQLAGNHKLFFQGYRKRILHFHDIEEPDEETAEEEPPKPKRRKTKTTSSAPLKMDGEDDSGTKNKCEQIAHSEDQHSTDALSPTMEIVTLGDSVVDRSGASTPMIDYSTLGSGTSHTNVNTFEDNPSLKQGLKMEHLKPPKIKLKLGIGNIGKNGNQSSSPEDRPMSRSILLPERDGLEVTPVPDSVSSPFYPGEEQLPLHADFDFHEKKEETAEKRRDWEKCTATIQFDKDTKSLFQHLQRPYGNHSSFFRHLVLLEKYWRSGELILSPCANSRATTYINSVQNRIHAYEGRSPSSSHYGATLTSAKSITSSATTPVPVIDLPLKRRLGGGILTASDGSSKPVTITSVPSVSISPQPMSFTPISTVGTGVLSRMPFYPSLTSNPPITTRKVLIDTSTGGHFQPSRRIPNVLQVTTGGKSFSLVPNVSQIRQIHTLQQQQYQKQHIPQQQSSTFEPMICDVRSLATENGSNLWERNIPQTSSKSQLHQQSNVSVALLPKTSTIQSSGITIKPSTIVTPTGIILSRKPEISVTAITDKRDISLKPKAVSGRKEFFSKVKTVADKLDIAKAKAVLEKKDIIVHATVTEVKDSMPNTKC